MKIYAQQCLLLIILFSSPANAGDIHSGSVIHTPFGISVDPNSQKVFHLGQEQSGKALFFCLLMAQHHLKDCSQNAQTSNDAPPADGPNNIDMFDPNIDYQGLSEGFPSRLVPMPESFSLYHGCSLANYQEPMNGAVQLYPPVPEIVMSEKPIYLNNNVSRMPSNMPLNMPPVVPPAISAAPLPAPQTALSFAAPNLSAEKFAYYNAHQDSKIAIGPRSPLPPPLLNAITSYLSHTAPSAPDEEKRNDGDNIPQHVPQISQTGISNLTQLQDEKAHLREQVPMGRQEIPQPPSESALSFANPIFSGSYSNRWDDLPLTLDHDNAINSAAPSVVGGSSDITHESDNNLLVVTGSQRQPKRSQWRNVLSKTLSKASSSPSKLLSAIQSRMAKKKPSDVLDDASNATPYSPNNNNQLLAVATVVEDRQTV